MMSLLVFKAVLELLSFSQVASTQVTCNMPPPDVEPISWGQCTTTYTPNPGSCDTLGPWTIPSTYYGDVCRNRGCSVVIFGSEYRCNGTPCCAYPNTRDEASLCKKNKVCTCEWGFEMINGACYNCQRLHCYHPGCTSVLGSREQDCMTAMSRFCLVNSTGIAAYPQEVGIDEFGFLCSDPLWYGYVAYAQIPNCLGKTQSAACYSSAHRFCGSIGHGGAGIIQELGDGVAGLACVPTAWYGTVKMTELSRMNDRCNSPGLTQDPSCISAVHRYCTSRVLGDGGVIIELGQDEVAVGCIKGAHAKYVTAKI